MKLKIYLFLMFSMVAASLCGMDFPEDNLIKVKTTDQKKIQVDKAVLSQLGVFQAVTEFYPDVTKLPLPVSEKELNCFLESLKNISRYLKPKKERSNIMPYQKTEDMIVALVVADKLNASKEVQEALGEMVADHSFKQIYDEENFKSVLFALKQIPNTITNLVSKHAKPFDWLLGKIVDDLETKSLGDAFKQRILYCYQGINILDNGHAIFSDPLTPKLLVYNKNKDSSTLYDENLKVEEQGIKLQGIMDRGYIFPELADFRLSKSFLIFKHDDRVVVNSLKNQSSYSLPFYNVKNVALSPDEKCLYVCGALQADNSFNSIYFFSLHNNKEINKKPFFEENNLLLNGTSFTFSPNGNCAVFGFLKKKSYFWVNCLMISFFNSNRTGVICSKKLVMDDVSTSWIRKSAVFNQLEDRLVVKNKNVVNIYKLDQKEHTVQQIFKKSFAQNDDEHWADQSAKFYLNDTYIVITKEVYPKYKSIAIFDAHKFRLLFEKTFKGEGFVGVDENLQFLYVCNEIRVESRSKKQIEPLSYSLFRLKKDKDKYCIGKKISDTVGKQLHFSSNGGGYFSDKDDTQDKLILRFFNKQGEIVSKEEYENLSKFHTPFFAPDSFMVPHGQNQFYYMVVDHKPYDLFRTVADDRYNLYANRYLILETRKNSEDKQYELLAVDLKPLNFLKTYQPSLEAIGLLSYFRPTDWKFVKENFADTLSFFKENNFELEQIFKPKVLLNNDSNDVDTKKSTQITAVSPNSNSQKLLTFGTLAALSAFLLTKYLLTKK